MKKIIAVLLAMTMILTLCGCINVSVSTTNETETNQAISSPENGIKAEKQETDLSNLEIAYPAYGFGLKKQPEFLRSDDSYYLFNSKIGDTERMITVIKEIPPEGKTYDQAREDNTIQIMPVYSLIFNLNLSELPNGLAAEYINALQLQETSHNEYITEDGGYIYCATLVHEYDGYKASPEIEEELSEIEKTMTEMAESIVTFKPQFAKLSFKTLDMNGKEITSEELFGKKDITMINFFTSWCSACAAEMGDLLELNNMLEGTNKQLVLCICDAKAPDDEKFKKGMEMIDENGGNGLYVICLNDDMANSIGVKISAYPTNYLVDSTGQILIDDSNCERKADAFNNWIESYLKK